MRGLLAPDGVLSALLDDERDELPLALEVLPRGRVAAHGDDLPGRVPERIEEEAALLADHVLELGPAQLAVVDHPEERMVQPRVRLLGLLQEGPGEFGRRQCHGAPS